MLKKLLITAFILPLIAILTGAWTFEIIEKPGGDDIVRGMQARDAGDYQTAIDSFEQAIDNSVDYNTKARAMAQIAVIYLKDEPVSPNMAQKALQLLTQSEQLGYSRASLLLGDMYQKGKGIQPDYYKAYEYFSKVKDRYANALISMAEISSNTVKARDYIARAVAKIEADVNPSSEAMLRLARHFKEGRVVVANKDLSEYWYNKAISAGSKPAIMELANIWVEEEHQPKSDITSLWKKASALGNIKAALELGYAYALGDGVPRDKVMSEQYLTRAVEADVGNAYRIARWYEKHAEEDPSYKPVAEDWFEVAAINGNPDAIIRKARAYWSGNGVDMDRQFARELYDLAAHNGSEKAALELAKKEERIKLKEEKRAAKQAAKEKKRAAKRLMLERKRTGGLKYWLPLAKQGNPEGMLHVGEAYIQGNGVELDKAKGLEWMKKSAAKGDGEAMYKLAELYSAGLAVSADIKKAYEWYEKSANAGYAAGQYQLGLGYARGIGVSKNIEKARIWLNEASKNGYSHANDILNSIK